MWKVVYLCSRLSNFLLTFVHHSHTNPLSSLRMVPYQFKLDLIGLVHSHHSFWNTGDLFIICVLYFNGRFVPFVFLVASWLQWISLFYSQPGCIWGIMTCKKDNGLQSMQYKASLFFWKWVPECNSDRVRGSPNKLNKYKMKCNKLTMESLHCPTIQYYTWKELVYHSETSRAFISPLTLYGHVPWFHYKISSLKQFIRLNDTFE